MIIYAEDKLSFTFRSKIKQIFAKNVSNKKDVKQLGT